MATREIVEKTLGQLKGFSSRSWDLLEVNTEDDLRDLPESLARRDRAPDAWVIGPSSPRRVVDLFDIIYNANIRRAAVDSDVAEADPLLIVRYSGNFNAETQRLLQAAEALFYKRFAVSEGMIDGGQLAVHAFSAAPSTLNSSLRARRDLISASTLVLDLNGVLVDKLFDPKRELPVHLYHARFGSFAIVVRPGAFRFVSWAVANFSKVVVWSSLRRENADGIFRAAFGDELRDRLAALLGNEESPRDEENPDVRLGRNCAIVKDLRWLSERVGFDPTRALIVDDSELKVRRDRDRALVLGKVFAIRELSDPAVVSDRTLPEAIKPAIIARLWLNSRDLPPRQAPGCGWGAGAGGSKAEEGK